MSKHNYQRRKREYEKMCWYTIDISPHDLLDDKLCSEYCVVPYCRIGHIFIFQQEIIDIYECKLNLYYLPKGWFHVSPCVKVTQCSRKLWRSRSKSPSLQLSLIKLQIRKCTIALIKVIISNEKYMKTYDYVNIMLGPLPGSWNLQAFKLLQYRN